MKPRVGDVVLVEWLDSFSQAQWRDMKSSLPPDLRCRSAGFLLEADARSVSVAHSVTGTTINEEESRKGSMTIPRCAVTKITVLKRA